MNHCSQFMPNERGGDRGFAKVRKLAKCSINTRDERIYEANWKKYRFFGKKLTDILLVKPSELNRLNILHIAGTKGKGSTSAFCERILRQGHIIENGVKRPLKTGLFTSPHLIEVRERIRINGMPMAKDDFCRHFYSVWDALENTPSHEVNDSLKPKEKPSYFRYLFLMACHAFLDENVDVAIMECGVGGEYDATNVIERPVVTAITSLGLDHVNILGPGLPEIAWHKAGIMKKDIPAISSPQPPPALEVLRSRAKTAGSLSISGVSGDDSFYVVTDADIESIRSQKLGLAGDHQYINAAVAQLSCREWVQQMKLKGVDIHLTDSQILEGLCLATWPGRAQTFTSPKYPDLTFYLDGAHTPESLSVCVEWFKSVLSQVSTQSSETQNALIFNCTGGRDPADLLRALSELHRHVSPFSKVLFSTSDITSAASKDSMNLTVNKDPQLKLQHQNQEVWQQLAGSSSEIHSSIDEALSSLVHAGGKWRVLVTGSLHLVGNFLNVAEAPVLTTGFGQGEDSNASRSSASVFAKSATLGSGSAPGTPNMNRVVIEAAELCENHLYVGTSDGFLLRYLVIKRDEDIIARLEERKLITGVRKPIELIVAVPTESKILVFSAYYMDSLLPISPTIFPPIKALTAASADKFLTSPFEIAVAKRRMLQTYRVGEKIGMDKEIPIPEGAILVSKFQMSICAADAQTYKMIDTTSGETIPLFPYDRSLMKPIVCAIGPKEFLLITTTPQLIGLGMFVTSRGDAIRGTLQWPSVPKSVVFQNPYIVSLLRNNTIEIHNLHSQELVQTIPIPASLEAKFLTEALFTFDIHGPDANTSTLKILVACKDSVIGLRMTSIKAQILEFFSARNVDSAIKLAEQYYKNSKDPDDAASLLQVYVQAGCVFLRETLFEDSLAMFQRGRLDPELLIGLFPEYTSLLDYKSSSQPLKFFTDLGSIQDVVIASLDRNYPDIDNETKISFSTALIQNAKEILLKYLEQVRKGMTGKSRREKIDAVLLRLYCEADGRKLNSFLKLENYCTIADCEAFLLEKKFDIQKFFRIYIDLSTRLLANPALDNDFPGVIEISNYLREQESDVVWSHSDALNAVLKKDIQLGVEIFTAPRRSGSHFQPDQVTVYLSQFGDGAVRRYLEYLVNNGDKDGSRHTQLGLIYVKQIRESKTLERLKSQLNEYWLVRNRPKFVEFLSQRSDDFSKLRCAFLIFMDTSQYLDAKLIAEDVLNEPDLLAERAAVLWKQREFDASLSLMVHDLHDYETAEYLCQLKQSSHQPEGEATDCWSFLLELYLKDDTRWIHEYSRQAVKLINKHCSELEFLKVCYSRA
ncbi:Folylpolyglutamate synthetase [Blyttiomyces sp. JEL0837]|nr:Folylpolyglutamate synthetase [Blyttiomyces sp. JEL0837]